MDAEVVHGKRPKGCAGSRKPLKQRWHDGNSRSWRGYADTGIQSFAFFFFSREEPRPHVHVSHPDDEAKFCISPTVDLASNIGLSSPRIKEAEHLDQNRQQEIIHAWNNYFGY